MQREVCHTRYHRIGLKTIPQKGIRYFPRCILRRELHSISLFAPCHCSILTSVGEGMGCIMSRYGIYE